MNYLNTPLADEMFRRIEGYKMLAFNPLGQYTREAQDFVTRTDTISDIPDIIATNVLYPQDENIRDGTTFCFICKYDRSHHFKSQFAYQKS